MVWAVGGFSEAWCFKEKRARNRTARGVFSDVRAARRGSIGSFPASKCGAACGESVDIAEGISFAPDKIDESRGSIAVGAMVAASRFALQRCYKMAYDRTVEF